MKRFFIYTLLLLFTTNLLSSVNLSNQRIRKISGRKQSIYVLEGIFHNGSPKYSTELKKVRHSYSSSRGYERVVFDFTSNNVPRIYAHYNAQERKISVDFFKTSLSEGIGSFGVSKLVEKINFFPLSKEITTVEIVLKKGNKVEFFYLENPGRLVIDLKI